MILVANVSKSLGDKKILDDVTFGGEGMIALLGRNGAGKTTLMRLLTGIWKPDAGSIAVDGHDLAADPIEAKRVLGYQPEFPDLHPKMRARELWDFVAAARGISNEERNAAIERFGAAALADKTAGSMSQGERRVVTLVGATMHKPPVLLLDEPTNALDPHRVAALKDYLRSSDGPRTALISTHQLDFVVTIAKTFILIARGKIVAQGSLEELRAQLSMPNASLEKIVLKHT